MKSNLVRVDFRKNDKSEKAQDNLLSSSAVSVRRGLALSMRSCSNLRKLPLGFFWLSYHSLIIKN